MKDGYAFSGGPWKLDGGKAGWKKGKSITLVPNDAYWGTKPSIAKAIFQFVPESSAELEAVKTGQVVAAYPLPHRRDRSTSSTRARTSRTTSSFGNQFEGFWLNAKAFPLDSQAVRQALMYATDRQAIVDQILKPAIREGRVLQSFIVPTFKTFYTPAFDKYTPNQDKVDQLMTGRRLDEGGPTGSGRRTARTASFEVQTRPPGNESRALTEQLWQSQLQAAGFDVKIKNLNSDVLFGRSAPEGPVRRRALRVGRDARPGSVPDLLLGEHPVEGEQLRRAELDPDERPDDRRDVDGGRLDARPGDPRRRQRTRGRTRSADYVASIPLFQTPTLFVYDHDDLGGNAPGQHDDGSVLHHERVDAEVADSRPVTGCGPVPRP